MKITHRKYQGEEYMKGWERKEKYLWRLVGALIIAGITGLIKLIVLFIG